MTRNSYVQIENEAAYAAAIARRIRANRAKTARAKWMAMPDAQLLHDWLYGCNAFGHMRFIDQLCTQGPINEDDGSPEWVDHFEDPITRRFACKCKTTLHPLHAMAKGDFLDKMRATIDEWGGLTEGQHNAVAKSYAKAVERLAGRDEARKVQNEADRTTSHVGEVGERRDWLLTVERVLSFEGEFGVTYFNICRDADRNVIVYKGSKAWERGQTVACEARVKAHNNRDGVPQTIIQRPTVTSITITTEG